jgi:DNA invertase Pin-like site-specific DNA recombinase
MAHVGYARVSSSGQSLRIQLDKLKHCHKIYKEKRSGVTADRPQFKECMNYLREGDTLFVTRLDRLARSVVHLSKLSDWFSNEGINLVVIDQNIDTTTSTGKLMFNMLAAIAEFENDLRRERQTEGVAKAQERGVKFGRPAKVTDEIKRDIYTRRIEGATIREICSEFKIGQATVYRAINEIKELNNV